MDEAVLFYCDGDDGRMETAMRRTLATLDTNIELRVWPSVGPREDITYAAVWNPPTGFFDGLNALKAVLALSAGVDRLLSDPDLPPAIPIVRLEDAGMAEAMSEYVLYGVLRAHRHMQAYEAAQRECEWVHEVPVVRAAEFRIGILGAGVLGQAVAERLVVNGYPVTCWSNSKKPSTPRIHHLCGNQSLDELAAISDVLVCLLPLTPDTQGILNQRLFRTMPAGGFVINAARGAHLVDTDLLEAVQTGHLSGALLDVMAPEPACKDHPFWSEPRISLTPHIAAPSPPEASARQACRALAALLRGEDAVPGLVNRTSGY